jgi:hypothetical protein
MKRTGFARLVCSNMMRYTVGWEFVLGIMPDIVDPILTTDPPASSTDILLQNNSLIASPSVHNKTEKNIHRSRRRNMIFKMPLNTREYILIIIIIITLLALLASLLAIKLCRKHDQRNSTTSPGKLSVWRMMHQTVAYRKFFSPRLFTRFIRQGPSVGMSLSRYSHGCGWTY